MTPRDDMRAWRLAVSAVVWAMYGVSLALPAVVAGTTNEGRPYLGYEALQFGWFWGGAVLPEIANVALLAGWTGYMLRQATLALIGGVAAAVLSLTTFWTTKYTADDVLVGFWLWCATMVAFSLGAAWEFFIETRALQTKPPPQGQR